MNKDLRMVGLAPSVSPVKPLLAEPGIESETSFVGGSGFVGAVLLLMAGTPSSPVVKLAASLAATSWIGFVAGTRGIVQEHADDHDDEIDYEQDDDRILGHREDKDLGKAQNVFEDQQAADDHHGEEHHHDDAGRGTCLNQRLSNSEWDEVKMAAAEHGIPAAEFVRNATLDLGRNKKVTDSAAMPPAVVALIERIYRSTYIVATLKRDEMLREGRGDELDEIIKAARETQAKILEDASE